jgi:predicted nucleotidyltransferase
MMFSVRQKDELLEDLVSCLQGDGEIRKIVVFGSFLSDANPNDLDVAVFQDSTQPYLPLALKYRRQTRSVSARIPLDIVPVKQGSQGAFLSEIRKGKVIYEKRSRAVA